jgi:phosphate transport system permease protein
MSSPEAIGTEPMLGRPTDRLRRRKVVNRSMEMLAMLAALMGIAILAVLVYKIVRNGASALNWNLFTLSNIPQAPEGIPQGLANDFVGTIVIVGLAAAMAIPIGVLVAVYLVEYAPARVRNVIRLFLDVLMGIPAIVLGVFYFGLLVVGDQQRAIYASIALATLMLPLVARSTSEVLQLVPNSLREAALGLGVPRWRTVLGVVLPQTVGGVITGSILAISRIAGEAAPLLLLSSVFANVVSWNPMQALPSLPLVLFNSTEEYTNEAHARAWAGALVLTIFILLTSLVARWFAARSRRKLGRTG